MTIDYAIINTGGKQYRVREGDTVSVETLDGEIGSDFIFDRVLMTSINGKLTMALLLLKVQRLSVISRNMVRQIRS